MSIKYIYCLCVLIAINSCGDHNGHLLDGETAEKTHNFLDLKDDSPKEIKSEAQEIIHKDSMSVPQKLLKSSVTVIVKNIHGVVIKLGSGVFISPGLIATNAHVVESGKSFKVKLNETQFEYSVSVIATDQLHDLAILKSERTFPDYPLLIDEELPKIGSHILVAGSPEGLEGTISEGIISSIRSFDGSDHDLLQISAPISPGSSGGPIINDKGELIGISVSSLVKERSQNLNFGVPVKYITHLVIKYNFQ